MPGMPSGIVLISSPLDWRKNHYKIYTNSLQFLVLYVIQVSLYSIENNPQKISGRSLDELILVRLTSDDDSHCHMSTAMPIPTT
jgi:hypothetical protein